MKKQPKVLFLRDDDKIGDMVVSTSILRELKNSGYNIDIVTGKSNFCVIEYSDLYNDHYTYEEKLFSIIKLALTLRKNNYDLIIDMGELISIPYLMFIRLINARNVVGFNKNNIKSYNLNINYNEYTSHVIERYKKMLDALNVPFGDLKYEINIPEIVENRIVDFINNLPYKKCSNKSFFCIRKKRYFKRAVIVYNFLFKKVFCKYYIYWASR